MPGTDMQYLFNEFMTIVGPETIDTIEQVINTHYNKELIIVVNKVFDIGVFIAGNVDFPSRPTTDMSSIEPGSDSSTAEPEAQTSTSTSEKTTQTSTSTSEATEKTTPKSSTSTSEDPGTTTQRSSTSDRTTATTESPI